MVYRIFVADSTGLAREGWAPKCLYLICLAHTKKKNDWVNYWHSAGGQYTQRSDPYLQGSNCFYPFLSVDKFLS